MRSVRLGFEKNDEFRLVLKYKSQKNKRLLKMSTNEVKLRIESLSHLIEEHNFNYYVKSAPSISDYEYDMLLRE